MNAFRLGRQDQANLVDFLRDLVQTPSPSTQESGVAERVVAEMKRLDFRNVYGATRRSEPRSRTVCFMVWAPVT
jgi:hypothetical protein